MAADSGCAGPTLAESAGFCSPASACWSSGHVTRERKPSAVSLQRRMGEVRRTERESERERGQGGGGGGGCPLLTLALTAESQIVPRPISQCINCTS